MAARTGFGSVGVFAGCDDFVVLVGAALGVVEVDDPCEAGFAVWDVLFAFGPPAVGICSMYCEIADPPLLDGGDAEA